MKGVLVKEVLTVLLVLLTSFQGDAASLKGTNRKIESQSNVTGSKRDSDNTCLRGLPDTGHTVCCSPVCWTCSRTEECNAATTPQEHKDNCCPGAIVAKDESCDEKMSPCKLNPQFTMKWKHEQTLPITEPRHERNRARVKQAEFRAILFYECKVKYDFAVDLANNVKKLARALVDEANAKTAEYQAKLATLPNFLKVAAAMSSEAKGPNDAMRRFMWENEVESSEDKARFYGQIERNAVWVAGNGTEGLDKVDVMKVNIQTDIERILEYKEKVDVLHDDSIRVYRDAEMLWKQWQDSSKTYNCSPLPIVRNHEVMCKQPNTADRRCNVKCQLGFDGEGTRNSLRCIKQGEFGKQLYGELTGIATCLGRSCGLPPLIPQAVVINQEIRFPDAALYACDTGYSVNGKADGPKTFEMACGHDGPFPLGMFLKDEATQKCSPVSCGESPKVKNSFSVEREYFYTEIVEVTCNDGYTTDGLASGHTKFNVSCLANGLYTASQHCRPVRCGPIPSVVKASLLTQAVGDQFFPAELEYKCAHGYSLDQNPTGPASFTLNCPPTGDFQWKEHPTQAIPSCRVVSAGMSPPVTHGLYQRREMFYGESVLVIAETGYSIGGLPNQGLSFTLEVTAEGTYKGLVPFRPVSCGAKPEVNFGKTDFNKAESVYGDIFTYTCEPGYSFDATAANAAESATVRCEADGSFSKFPARGDCVNIDDCLSHTCGPFGYCVDELLNYTCQCDSGYEVTVDKDTDEKTCGNIDDCGPDACGVGKCIDGLNDYSCECPDGYYEHATAEEKTCFAVTCGVPPGVTHALTKPMDVAGSKVYFPSTVLYQCAVGYTLEGKAGGHNHFQIDCQSNKYFSSTSVCKPNSCGDTPDWEHSTKSMSTAVFGNQISYTCKHGYTIDGTAEGDTGFHVNCHASGQYSDGFPCLPIKCGEPGEIANSGRPSGSRYFGDVVTYSCFDGFTVDGNKDSAKSFEATCGVEGHFVVTTHSCHPVLCGHPPAEIHVLHASLPENDISYPQVAEITCRDGFTVAGDPNGQATFTIQCLANGEFERVDPHNCEAVKCGPVPPMANASLRMVKSMETGLQVNTNVLQFGQKAYYDCLPGFTAGGAEDATTEVHAECFASGEYSFPQDTLICKNVNDCAHHTCGPYGDCIDEIGPAPAYSCNCHLGYAMQTLANGEKYCGNINDCKGRDCGSGVCKDLVDDYTCICPVGHYVGEEDGEKTCLPMRCRDKAPVTANASLEDAAKADKPVDFPHSLKYKCIKGHSVDGTAVEAKSEFQTTCEAHGELDGLMTCQPIKCGVPHVFSYTHLVNFAPQHQMIYQNKAMYECDTGYTIGGSPTDGTTFEVECLETAVLSDPKTCQPVKCGHAPEIENGHALLSGHVLFGMSIQYKCEQGYTLSGVAQSSNAFSISCKADGQFSEMPSSMPCKAVSAGSTPEIPHAYLAQYGGEDVASGVTSVTATYPHAVEWKCKDGYSDSGGPAGKTKFLSHVNSIGQLEPPPPAECKLIVFTISGEIKNARNGQGLNGAEAELVDAPGDAKVIANNGFFTLVNVPKGTIKIKYTAPNYIDNIREINVDGDINVGGLGDISMSPKMSPSQWRATIKWGARPADLDTYVQWGWSKTCWFNRFAEASNVNARLEHDDVDGYGPETAYIQGGGKCNGGAHECDVTYQINDYEETGTMPDKEAEVTLYNGDSVVGTWNIGDCLGSVSSDKNWWHVFTIDTKTNKLKWSCKESDSSHVHLMNTGNTSQVDYESYVGPFPGRYFRHSRHKRSKKPVGRVTLLSKKNRRRI